MLYWTLEQTVMSTLEKKTPTTHDSLTPIETRLFRPKGPVRHTWLFIWTDHAWVCRTQMEIRHAVWDGSFGRSLVSTAVGHIGVCFAHWPNFSACRDEVSHFHVLARPTLHIAHYYRAEWIMPWVGVYTLGEECLHQCSALWRTETSFRHALMPSTVAQRQNKNQKCEKKPWAFYD